MPFSGGCYACNSENVPRARRSLATELAGRKRQEHYEELLEEFFEEYIPRYCDERINQLAEEGEDERHPEIEPLFDEYLKENEWR